MKSDTNEKNTNNSSKKKTTKTTTTKRKTTSTKKNTTTKTVSSKPKAQVTKKVEVKTEEIKDDKLSLDKKTLWITIITVILLAMLIISAAFAYFMVNATNDYQTTKVEAGVGDVGSVAFESENNNLILDLTAMQMLQQGKDIAYYASINGATTTETTETMGTISVTGEGIFDCTYTMEIKATAKSDDTNMYTKFQNMNTKSEGQIVLTLNTQNGAQTYDFNTANLFTITYNGTAKGLKDGSPEEISAQLKLVNKTGVVQDDLKGTDITLSFSVSNFGCEIVG